MSEVTHRLATKESVDALTTAMGANTQAIQNLPNATQTAADNANAAAAAATTAAAAISGMVAGTYSSSATYQMGDYVYYSGNLYKCISNITTAEAWTAAHWKQVSLADDVDGLINALILPVREASSDTNIPANENDNFWPLSSEYMAAGDYLLICYHDGESNANNRDAFIAQGKDENEQITTLYPGNLNDHTSGWKIEAVTLPFSGLWRFGRWVSGNISAFTIKHFMVANPAAVSDIIKQYGIIGMNAAGLVVPYANNIPSFTKTGTTISFYCARLLAYYFKNRDAISYIMINMDQAVDVPHDSHLVFNYKSETLEVLTDGQYRANFENTIHLFYNSSGVVTGDFSKYLFAQNLSDEIDLGFYGDNYPTFQIDSSKTITVTIPASYARVNSIDKDPNGPYRFHNGRAPGVILAASYTVEHDHSLVYDYISNSITVTGDTDSYSSHKQMLLYNSNGQIIGPWKYYYLHQKMKELQESAEEGGDNFPSYYNDMMNTKLKAVNTQLSEIGTGNGDGFVFITDIHYPDNQMHSPALVKAACKRTGIDTVILNGDYINRETEKANAIMQTNRVCGLYEYPAIDSYRVVGNHEFNNPGNSQDPEYIANELTADELRFAILNPIKKKITFDPNTLSYYFDNEESKIRYFVGAVTKTTALNSASIKWIANELQSVPNDYSVFVFFHTVLTMSGDVIQPIASASDLIAVVDAAKNKTTVTISGSSYDYTGKTFEFIGVLCGDYHADMAYSTSGGVDIYATTTDSMQEAGGLNRVSGTTSEHAFDVVTINKTLKKVKLTRIGAGIDREFSY